MSESIGMTRAKIMINNMDKISLIKEMDYRFDYGCAVRVDPLERLFNNPSDDSYKITISVNEEIERLEQRLKDAETTMKALHEANRVYSESSCERGKQLKEAENLLKFYANEENYEPQDYKGMHNLPPISGEYVPLSDNGGAARRYFNKYKERR